MYVVKVVVFVEIFMIIYISSSRLAYEHISIQRSVTLQ